MNVAEKNLFVSLPSVDDVLKSDRGREWMDQFPRKIVVSAIRNVIAAKRKTILEGLASRHDSADMSAEIDQEIHRLSSYSLKHVINATGIVVHTNLGRSCISESVLKNIVDVSIGYSNLEYDIDSGRRGKRHSHVKRLLTEISGAEDALIVNNNAAAVLICLNTIARGKEVIVSRGELVEIGGSFRVPDVMIASGAVLKEVGTTNKTHLRDYRNAVNDNTAMILKVHKSNYKIVGFTAETGIEELIALGRECDIPIMYDLGSGSLLDLKPFKIYSEPTVQEIVKSGIDLVTFSGDKLLGGPQGGIILGKKKLIDSIQKNPLARAIRIDKFSLAGFEATFMEYMDPERALKAIPTLRMLFQPLNTIRGRAETLASAIQSQSGDIDVQVIQDSSRAGGGSLPEEDFPTYAVAIKPEYISINTVEKRLRKCSPPIIVRIRDKSLLLDARTVEDRDIAYITTAVIASLRSKENPLDDT